MQKKILINAPLLSASGYGEMARFALSTLRKNQDKFDIYVNVINWGQTGYLFEEDETYEYIKYLRIKTDQYARSGGQFDISLQITIPNEWKKMAPVNIGYTAGIETNFISPAWLDPSNQMDRVIVISEHAKSSFVNTIFGDQNGNQYRVTTEIDVVHFPLKTKETEEFKLELTSPFNFLTVNQWGPRKNIEQLIHAFVEEFRYEDVGLVVKTNTANDSNTDRAATESRLAALLASFGQRKCKVYLVHGRLSDKQMASIYHNSKVKAFASATHGEGFGFPIFEAVEAELPIIATDWSGHLDFLTVRDEQENNKKMFAKVDYDLKPIDPSHVWPGVMESGVQWAYPNMGSLRSRMREVYKDETRFKSWAKKLRKFNELKFSEEAVESKFMHSFSRFLPNEEQIAVQDDELIVL
jgi:glycosyltransferase involved in cell wall biosynthesis